MAVNRRSLAGAGFLAVLGTPAAAIATNPDAELIALCAEFDALECEFRATDFAAAPRSPEAAHADAVQQRLGEQQAMLIEQRIQGLTITSLDGARALARIIALYNAELFEDAAPGGYISDMLGALVGGLIGWPVE